MRKNKLLLLLALLLTAATGARAQWTGGTYTATANENLGAITVNGDATLTINSDVTVTVTGGINVASGTLTVTGPGTLVVNGAKGNDGASGWKGSNGRNGGVAISGNIIVQGGATVTATGGTGGNGGNGELEAGNGGNGGVAFAGTLTYKSGTVTANGGSGGSGGWGDDMERYASSGSAGKAFANDVDFTQTTGYSVTNGTSTIGSVLNQRKVVISGGSEPAIPSGPEVAWNAAEKTGTFKMPGGNVTLEPEYYPQATVADGGVTAADADARATTDDPLVKVDATKLTGAKKLMYFVSNSGTTAPAYDAEGWTDQLPTAEGLTQQGIVYVWYYPVGTDEGVDGATATYSDGDICLQSITARIAAAPTYAVTFAEGTDPNEWTASPNADVTKGQTVTVTYSGSKKVIGVKAEKKAAAPAAKAAAEATAEDKGKLIGADGNIYDDADAATAANTTAVAKIIYIGETGHATYNHGLALALTDEGQMTWEAAKTACNTTKNTSTPVTDATWLLASKEQWDYMLGTNGAGGYTALRDGFSGIAGDSNLQSREYWSSTEVDYNGIDQVDSGYARFYIFNYGGIWSYDGKGSGYRVRACLAF